MVPFRELCAWVVCASVITFGVAEAASAQTVEIISGSDGSGNPLAHMGLDPLTDFVSETSGTRSPAVAWRNWADAPASVPGNKVGSEASQTVSSDSTADRWVKLYYDFDVPAGMESPLLTLSLMADDIAKVYLNGTQLGGIYAGSGTTHTIVADTPSLFTVGGSNTLMFHVVNAPGSTSWTTGYGRAGGHDGLSIEFDGNVVNAPTGFWKSKVGERAAQAYSVYSAYGLGASIAGVLDVLAGTKVAGGTLLFSQIAGLAGDMYIYEKRNDPPVPDYQSLFVVNVPVVPLDGIDEIDAAHAAVLQDYVSSQAEYVTLLQAMLATMERAGGAANANDAQWTLLQQEYFADLSVETDRILDRLAGLEDAVGQTFTDMGLDSITITQDDIDSFLANLAATGLPQEERDILALFGLTEADLADQIQRMQVLDTSELVGMSVAQIIDQGLYADLAEAWAPVPEPATVALLAFGWLAASRRRRR